MMPVSFYMIHILHEKKAKGVTKLLKLHVKTRSVWVNVNMSRRNILLATKLA